MFYFPWLCCAFLVYMMLNAGKLSLLACVCIVLIMIVNRKNMFA